MSEHPENLPEQLRHAATLLESGIDFADHKVLTMAAAEIERLRSALASQPPMAGTALAAAKFVMWALMEGSWQGADIDGGAAQDKAVELGLIVETKYDPAKHGDSDCCDPDDQWFIPSDALLTLLKGPARALSAQRETGSDSQGGKEVAIDAAFIEGSANAVLKLREQAEHSLPTVEDVARVMWEGDHEGAWDDPHANSKLTRYIYMGNAEDALNVMRQSLGMTPLPSTTCDRGSK